MRTTLMSSITLERNNVPIERRSHSLLSWSIKSCTLASQLIMSIILIYKGDKGGHIDPMIGPEADLLTIPMNHFRPTPIYFI